MFRLALLCLFGLTYSQVSAELATEAIVGGEYARPGDFKYHVLVQYHHQRCGGAIIADKYILTAAHCVTDNNGHILHERFLVVAGTHNVFDFHGSIRLGVQTVFIPKIFNRQAQLHDIAVLKLTHSLQLSHHHNILEKVNLPKPNAHFENEYALVSGYGDQAVKIRKNAHGKSERYDEKADGKLKFAGVHIISNDQCGKLNHRHIPPTNICAQMIQHRHQEGVCGGDNGGPLVNVGEVIGVLSLSPLECSESHRAAMYTRVSSYLKFINSVIHGHPGNDVTWANVPH